VIRRYEPNETILTHNKFVLHPLSALVREEANGMFELEMELPKNTIINKRDLVVAPSPRGEQPFRVYRITKSLQGKKVFARHIFYDLANAFLINNRPTNATVQDALQSIFLAVGSQGFTYLSDVVDRKTAYYERKNPVEAIIGADNSILKLWGGNLVRDKKEIKIQASGIDRGFEIRLGKNLVGIEDDSDDISVITRLYPTVVIDQVVKALPENYIDSPLIGAYPQPIVKEVRIDLSKEEEVLPITEIYVLMRAYCQNLYSVDNIDKPIANYKVDFVQLAKIARIDQELKYSYEGLEQLTYNTIETLTYAQLEGTEIINQFIDLFEQIDLYDLVKIRVKELDIDLKARVISYKYDCLKARFASIELGGFKPSAQYQTANVIQRLANELEVSKSELAKIWDIAVNVITGNKGGYKITLKNADNEPYEDLYMDTPDIATAQKILRINNSGIAGTTGGINGPYDVAITTDGWVLAERILAYTLSAISADLGTVTTGKLRSTDGTIEIDLSNRTFRIGGGATDIAKHTNSESRYEHADGSYTAISSAGIQRYVAGLGKRYKYLTHIGSYSKTGSGYSAVELVNSIYLPAEFNGIPIEDIKVMVWFSDAYQAVSGSALKRLQIGGGTAVAVGLERKISFSYNATFVASAGWSVVLGYIVIA